MTWAVLLVVIGCCTYAVGASWRRLARLHSLGEFSAGAVLARLRSTGPAGLMASDVPAEFHDELMCALRATPRHSVALCNEVMLQVQLILEDGRALDKGAWRVCVASAGAGLLAVVWSSHWMAGVIATLGLCSTVATAWIGRSAELQQRRSREAWNTLIRGCAQSFPDGSGNC